MDLWERELCRYKLDIAGSDWKIVADLYDHTDEPLSLKQDWKGIFFGIHWKDEISKIFVMYSHGWWCQATCFIGNHSWKEQWAYVILTWKK
jgi:hypothetical protein